jgi:uncharacterized protein (TIGR02246 family)
MEARFARSLLVLLLLSFPAWAQQEGQPQPGAAADRSAEVESIRALSQQWFQASVAKDAPKFSSFYAPLANLFPPHGPLIAGKPKITSFWTQFFAMPGLAFEGAATSIEVAASADMAYEYGTFKLTVSGPDGQPVVQDGKYVVVWKKQPDGVWKVVADIFNTDK